MMIIHKRISLDLVSITQLQATFIGLVHDLCHLTILHPFQTLYIAESIVQYDYGHNIEAL